MIKKTIEQLKEDLQVIASEIKAQNERKYEMREKANAVHWLRDVYETLKYRFTPDHKVPNLYENILAIFPMETIAKEIENLDKETNSFNTDHSLSRREHELNFVITEITKLKLNSDELLSIRNSATALSGYDLRAYFNLSNYKKHTLFNQQILESAIFIVKIEGTRKADTLIEAGFFESKLYVNILKMASKMRTTYVLTEDSDDVQVEIASYDSKAETFQKLGTLPSVKKESFIELIQKEA